MYKQTKRKFVEVRHNKMRNGRVVHWSARASFYWCSLFIFATF